MSIQAIVFDAKQGWTPRLAENWLKKHNKRPIKPVDTVYVHGQLSQLRYRMLHPSFKYYSTKKTKQGINFIIGYTEYDRR